jgi:hypothetical protein
LWDGVIEWLRGQFTCLAVDLPGLGRIPSIPFCAKHLELLAEKTEGTQSEGRAHLDSEGIVKL